MVNIPKDSWYCSACSGHSNTKTFDEYSSNTQEQDVIDFLGLSYAKLGDFMETNSDALSLFTPSSSNPVRQRAISQQPKKVLFRVGNIWFLRAREKNDWRLPVPLLDEDEYAQSVGSFVSAMKYCGMTTYSEDCLYPESGYVTEDMNNASLDDDSIAPMSKRNLEIFRAFKDNLKEGVYPPVRVVHDERYGFSVEALKEMPPYTLITEYCGEVVTMEQSSSSDSLMILLHTGEPNTSLIIDPTKAGNIARFLSGVNNRSLASKRKANVRTRRFCMNGRVHVALFTSRRVEAGEKLNYDYNAGREGQSLERWLSTGFYDTRHFF